MRSIETGALEWRVEGAWALGGFGAALADAGERGGDGSTALWVGAPHGVGRVVLVEPQGLTGLHLGSPGDHAGFGAALASIGDLDGDGIDDVAVGAPGFSGTVLGQGWVGVFSGAAGGLLWSHEGAGFDRMGTSLARVDDLNGDALPDLAVGVPFADGAGFNRGALEMRSGRDGALLWRAFGAADGDRLGERVARAGDVDGDGEDDVIVGLPGSDASGPDSGAAWVLSGRDGSQLLEVPGFAGGEFAAAVAGLGDVDGDGRADVALGSSANAGGHGRVRVVSGADGSLITDLRGEEPSGWFGAAVLGLGDTNADGQPDLAVGAPGHDDHPELVGHAWVLSSAPVDLWSDGHAVSPGGVQRLEGEFPGLGGHLYHVLGSLTGTAPGFGLGPFPVALTPDLYFNLVLQGVAPVVSHLGVLDAGGRLAFDFVPTRAVASAAPFAVWHACLIRDPISGDPSAVSVSVPAWVQ
ncbi:MAG: integrin alpha [Planctomycetota bacterium]